MSGRRFRILSDSEDENTPLRGTVEEQEEPALSSNAGGAILKKKRTRILSDDSSNNGSDDSSTAEDDENNTSLGRNDASICGPQRIVQRHSSPENDGDQSDGNESTGNRLSESARGARKSQEHRSDEDRSDRDGSNPSPSARPNSDDENDADGENRGPRNDEAEEDRGTPRRVVKKRIVKNPQPKLDATRLTGERGLGRLRNMHPLIRLKGKGHEHEDLRCILHNLQLWGHRMFPKMQTKDIFERCEKLGAKMPVRVYLRRMRTGEIHDFFKPIVDSGDDVARGLENSLPEDHAGGSPPMEVEEEQPPVGDERDIFQELLDHQDPPNQTVTTPTPSASRDVAATNQADVQARIEEKRMEALRRREELRARREAQRKEEEMLEAQMVQEMEVDDGVPA